MHTRVQNRLFEAHPHIQLLVFGYEIIDLGGLVCGLMGLVLLPECSGSAACINGGPGMEPRGTYALQDAANELENLYPSNVVSIDLRGSMQEASGTVVSSCTVLLEWQCQCEVAEVDKKEFKRRLVDLGWRAGGVARGELSSGE